jgi:HEPN domain-containing protein
MKRRDFQRLARMRLKDARTLLSNGNNEGAYYLAGLAVECALKSAIARRTQRHEFPPKPKIVYGMYEHDLSKLLASAGLEATLNGAVTNNATLKANWSLVKGWTVESRYHVRVVSNARGFYRSVAGRNGVMSWLRLHW